MSYSLNLEKLPRWLRIELEQAGFPEPFRLSQLTDSQKKLLESLSMIIPLVELGLIEVTYVDGVVVYHLPGASDTTLRRALGRHRKLGGRAL